MLRLGLVLGTHQLGVHVAASQSVAELHLTVQMWKSWHILSSELEKASSFFLPVPLDDAKFPRDAVLVEVAVAAGDAVLSKSSDWQICVYDPVRRRQLSERLGATVAGLLKATFRQGGDSIQVRLGDFPHVGSSHERLLACLGVLIRGVISRKRGETVLSCAGFVHQEHLLWIARCYGIFQERCAVVGDTGRA